MSIQNKYILDRINAIEMALSMLCSSIDSSINTQGRVSSTISNLVGCGEKMRSDYLKQLLNLKQCGSLNKSGDLLFHNSVNYDRLNDLAFYISSCRFNMRSLESRPTIKISKNKGSIVEFTKVVDGEMLTANYQLSEVLTEQEMCEFYGRGMQKPWRDTVKKFGILLKNIVTTESLSAITGDVLKEHFEGKLKLGYCIVPNSVEVILANGAGGRHLLNGHQLTDVYSANLTFIQFFDICHDLSMLEDGFEELVAKYSDDMDHDLLETGD